MSELHALRFELPDANQAEAALIRRDPALPGLSTLLDPAAFARLLADDAGTGPGLPPRCRYLRYKPGTSCVAGYERDGADGGPRWLQAKATSPGRHAQSSAHPRWRLGPGTRDYAWRSDPARALFLHLPTQDRELRAGRKLLDPDTCAPALARLLPGEVLARAGSALDVLRYKPGRRLVLRLGAAAAPDALLLRLCDAGSYEGARLGATLGAFLGGPALIAQDDAARLVASAWQPGRALDSGDPPGSLDPWQALGQTLARLHREAQPGWREALAAAGRVRDRAREAQALAQAIGALEALLPEALPHALRLAARLEAAGNEAAPQPVTIHGDLAPDQAVWTLDGRLLLIDWDRAALGEAAADFGGLAARLAYAGIEADAAGLPALDPALAAARQEAVVLGYRDTGRPLPDPRSRARQTASALLMRVSEPFRRRLPQWPAAVAALLEQATAILDDAGIGRCRVALTDLRAGVAETGPGAGPCDGAGLGRGAIAGAGADAGAGAALDAPPADAGLPRLAGALDAAHVGPLLLAALGLPAASRVEAPRLRRHKAGRRALIEYRVWTPGATEPQRLLGKLRGRGADLRSAALHAALRQRGFDGQADHGLRVPPALGLLPSLGLWLQGLEPGTPSTRLWLDRRRPAGERTALAARIGRALAALHRDGPASDRRWTPDDEREVLRRSLQQAAARLPALAPRLNALLEACDTVAAGLSRRAASHLERGIHRDFHPDQVLVDGERLVLVDLDLHAQGDPALDAGNFAAHLHELALRELGDAHALDAEQRAFETAFLAASPGCTPAALAAWHSLALARLVALSQLRPGREPVTADLLAICEQRLAPAGAEAGAPASGPSPPADPPPGSPGRGVARAAVPPAMQSARRDGRVGL